MAMIEISNLMKTYGDTMVLENINLEIEKGDVYGLSLIHISNGTMDDAFIGITGKEIRQ